MNESKSNSLSDSLHGPFLALIAAGAYFIAFKINQHLGFWVVYAQGINLIYLPAGVKNISILIARGWGAFGIFSALYLLALEFWSTAPAWQITAYCAVSTLSSLFAITVALRIFKISSDLTNLRLIHLPLIDLFTSVFHGLVANVFYFVAGIKNEILICDVVAMMVGDFLGNFIMMMTLFIAIKVFELIDSRR